MIFNITRPLKRKKRRWLLMSPIKTSFRLPFVLIPGQILLSNTCLLKTYPAERRVGFECEGTKKKKGKTTILSSTSLASTTLWCTRKWSHWQESESLSLRYWSQDQIASPILGRFTNTGHDLLFFGSRWPLNLEGLTHTHLGGGAFFFLFLSFFF